MTASEFDSGIAVVSDGDPSMWHGLLDDGWGSTAPINGGILMAMGANALRQMLTEARGHPDPLAFSARASSLPLRAPGRSPCSPSSCDPGAR